MSKNNLESKNNWEGELPPPNARRKAVTTPKIRNGLDLIPPQVRNGRVQVPPAEEKYEKKTRIEKDESKEGPGIIL